MTRDQGDADFPQVDDARLLSRLSGFSGAVVALMEKPDSGAKFVRKLGRGKAIEASLRDQRVRLEALAPTLSDLVTVPDILGEGTDGDHYWFDMQFVSGIDGISYLSYADMTRVERYCDAVSDLWQSLAAHCPPDKEKHDLSAIIERKILTIGERTDGRFAEDLDRLSGAAGKLSAKVQATASHGDLTLENMIFDARGGLALIDPIPAPVSHFWFDIAKAFQDIEGRWFLHRKRRLPLGITAGIRDRLGARIARRHPDYLEFHPVMLALCFARILPYCKSAKDEDFVRDRIRLALSSRLGKQEQFAK